jgi:transposase-like protein
VIGAPRRAILSGNGRRKWPAEEKLRIAPAGMQPGVEVSDPCRREGLNPNRYYLWKKQLLSSAGKVFEAKAGRPSAAEGRRAAEVRRPKGVIAEITSGNLGLKKGLSD